jgi:hypothetical protein
VPPWRTTRPEAALGERRGRPIAPLDAGYATLGLLTRAQAAAIAPFLVPLFGALMVVTFWPEFVLYLPTVFYR